MDPADYQGFLTHLASVGLHYRWSTIGYCLMPNHVHLVIEAPVAAVSRGMRDLTGTYARRFHRRHQTSGHLFGGRFHAVPVLDDRQLMTVVRYVGLNPTAAGLCADPADWPWSSLGGAMGRRPADPCLSTERLWALLDGDQRAGRAALHQLITGTPVPGT